MEPDFSLLGNCPSKPPHTGTWDVVYLIECLPSMHRQSWSCFLEQHELDMMVHTCNPSSQEGQKLMVTLSNIVILKLAWATSNKPGVSQISKKIKIQQKLTFPCFVQGTNSC